MFIVGGGGYICKFFFNNTNYMITWGGEREKEERDSKAKLESMNSGAEIW